MVGVTEYLIERALAEDVGAGDVTTLATVDAAAPGRRDDHAEGPGGDLGLDVAEAVFLRLDPDAVIDAARARGRVARVAGPSCG